ncbi:MAG: T9SS type A sorting domain-containing protein [Saprospiraceae bacterium]
MKKNILLICSMLFLGLITNAQITVTDAVFAGVNQSFETNIINGLQRIDVTAAGPNQTWDMANLQGTAVDYTVTDATAGAAFSFFNTSTIIMPEFGGTTGEAYINVTSNKMETVGIIATIPGLVTDFTVPLGQPRIDIETPMNYSDVSSSSFDFTVELDPHEPAGTQLDSVITALEASAGGLIAVDSIRVIFNTNRTTEVDAWGTLTTPAGTFDVLRLRKVDTTNTELQVRLSTFGIPNPNWQNPVVSLGVNPADLEDLGVGIDTVITYEYWDANEKQPILKYVADGNENPTYGQYARTSTSTKGIAGSNVKINAYPNPATDNFMLEMKNLDAGDYTLKMYNIIGKEVKAIPFRYNGDTKMLVQTGDLNPGTFIYRILNENDKSVATRRIIIVRP